MHLVSQKWPKYRTSKITKRKKTKFVVKDYTILIVYFFLLKSHYIFKVGQFNYQLQVFGQFTFSLYCDWDKILSKLVKLEVFGVFFLKLSFDGIFLNLVVTRVFFFFWEDFGYFRGSRLFWWFWWLYVYFDDFGGYMYILIILNVSKVFWSF